MLNLIPTSRIDHIRSAARQIVRNLGFMHPHLAGTQLSPSAVHSLIEIGYGTVETASALADVLRLEKSSVSRLLKKLETQGMLSVLVDPSDKRSRILALTLKGKTLLREIETYARNQLQSALGDLPATRLDLIEDGLFAFAAALNPTGIPSTQPETRFDIRENYQAGLIASVTGMHASFYSKNYGFGAVFERKVASEMSEFMGRIERPANTTFSAYRGDQLLGSVSIDGEDLGENTAHLRWFIVSPDARGLGVGKQLMEKATTFVDEHGFQLTRLWTFQGLDAARYLYESVGYRLVEEKPGTQWGTQVVEQEFARDHPT